MPRRYNLAVITLKFIKIEVKYNQYKPI